MIKRRWGAPSLFDIRQPMPGGDLNKELHENDLVVGMYVGLLMKYREETQTGGVQKGQRNWKETAASVGG